MVKGVKNDRKKTRWDILPWREVENVVKVMEFGLQKYGENNWQEVIGGETRYFNAAIRHLIAIRNGEDFDKETGAHHYAHAVCSILFAFWHSWHSKRNLKK